MGALSPTRDFNYVADTCAAFLAIDCEASIGQVVNAASTFEISIGDTAALIADVMNVDVEIVTDERRIRPKGSEVNRLFGDNSRLRQLTRWQPSLAALRADVDWLNLLNGSMTLQTWRFIALEVIQSES